MLATFNSKEPLPTVLGSYPQCLRRQPQTSSFKKGSQRAEYLWQEPIILWVTNKQKWLNRLKLNLLSMTLDWIIRTNLITLMRRKRFLKILLALVANQELYKMPSKRNSRRRWESKSKLKKRKSSATLNKKAKSSALKSWITSLISLRTQKSLMQSEHFQTWQKETFLWTTKRKQFFSMIRKKMKTPRMLTFSIGVSVTLQIQTSFLMTQTRPSVLSPTTMSV